MNPFDPDLSPPAYRRRTTGLILSEDQARAVGMARTLRDDGFTVFRYEARPSRITAFGVELPNGEQIRFA